MLKPSFPSLVDDFFKILSDTSSDIIHLNNKQGEILYANPASEALLGYTMEELLFTPAASLIHPDDLATINLDMQQASPPAPPPPRKIRLQKKDNSFLNVEVRGFVVPTKHESYIGAIIRDLSKLKELEQKRIQFSDSILQSQLETIREGILVVSQTNKILLTNALFNEMWSIPPEIAALFDHEIQIQTILDQLVDPKYFISQVQFLNENSKEISRNTLHLRDGRIFEYYSTPLYDNQKEYLARIWYFRDTTQEKLQELENLKTKKLQSIGVLAGGIAHDFNNVLAAILGNIELAEIYTGPKNRAYPLLQGAKEASIRAKDLTQQLLTFAEGGSPVKQTSSIAKTITDSANFALRDSTAVCNFNIPEDLWKVDVDTGQISQVIQNIVLNAHDAMPEGGVIKVSCENVTDINEETASLPAHNFIQVTICDSGPGIPKKYLDQIFDPYFSTKQEGNGLGLAICHSIISKHGGNISVLSDANRGTTFIIYLPVSMETSQDSSASTQKSIEEEEKATIMIMDDEPMVRDIAQQMLEHFGYNVLLTKNGHDAIQVYDEHFKSCRTIDLCIMDLTIPGGMGGKNAVLDILRINPEAKVIVASGYSNDPVMANYQEYGFKASIAKPFQLAELNVLINDVLG